MSGYVWITRMKKAIDNAMPCKNTHKKPPFDLFGNRKYVWICPHRGILNDMITV